MVGLGDTKKKIQKMVDSAERTYKRVNELRGQIEDLRAKVDRTSKQVDDMEYELAEQRAILNALAETEGIDIEQVLADAAIVDVEADDASAEADDTSEGHDGETSDTAGGAAAEPED